MLIQNFGLLWERASVEWARGAKGQLRGFKKQRDDPVDFAAQAGIYLLYEGLDPATHRVAYIGQAGMGKRGDGLYKLLQDHTEDWLWNRWTRFSWFGIYAVGAKGKLIHADADKKIQSSVRDVLNHLEASLMSTFEPALNSQGPRWKGAKEYSQWKGEAYDPGDPYRRFTPAALTSKD